MPSKDRPRSSRLSPLAARRIDLVINLLLFVLPVLIASSLAIRARLARTPQYGSTAAVEGLILDSISDAEQAIAWGSGARDVSSKDMAIQFLFETGTAPALLAKAMPDMLESAPAYDDANEKLAILQAICKLMEKRSDYSFIMGMPDEQVWYEQLLELQNRGALGFAGRMQLAQFIFINETGMNQFGFGAFQYQAAVYDPNAGSSSIAMSVPLDYDKQAELNNLYADVDTTDCDNAFPVYMEALRRIYIGEFDLAAQMLDAAESMDMPDTDIALLAALGIDEPGNMDQFTRATLWNFGRSSWPMLDTLEMAKVKAASQYWAGKQQAGRIQQLHASFMRLEKLTVPSKFAELEDGLLSGLPQSFVTSDAGREFRDAASDAGTMYTAAGAGALNGVWLGPGNGNTSAIDWPADTLSGGKLNWQGDYYNPYDFGYFSKPRFAEADKLDVTDLAKLERIRALDFSSVMLPEPQDSAVGSEEPINQP
ncbi:hypothetical protein KDL29_09635 [bacterium]|nr:hypothetical protein [bacterium]